MIRVLCVFGTRPEVVKMAPVVWELQKHPGLFEVRTCATAQHRGLLDQMLTTFHIQPDIDLDLMRAGQTPNQLASRVLAAIEPVLQSERPDWVLVQGDTTTVLSSAMAAYHSQVKIGHVEAGLRTWDRQNPFPEEMNRVLTDHLSDLCFAPTEGARANLLREGIAGDAISVTGNTVIDTLLWAAQQPATDETQRILKALSIPETTEDGSPQLILITAHRRENFGRPLEQICTALRTIARQGNGALKLVYPVHPNPRVEEPVHRLLGDEPHIELVSPVDYLTLVALMRRSTLILTDSGGIQEEAPSLGIPVLVMRETTERPEAVDAGVVRVVGTDSQTIILETNRLLQDETAYASMSRAVNPYGDGHASERIAQALHETDSSDDLRHLHRSASNLSQTC